jgi:uncharacterized protein
LQIYQFKISDKRFALDIESGNYFEIDKLVSDVLRFMQVYTEAEALEKLKKKYKHNYRLVDKIIKKILLFKKNDKLFSEIPDKEEVYEREITDLTLNVVNSCNLRCRYCWNKAGTYGEKTPDIQMMDEKVAIKAVDLLIRESRTSKNFVVDFYGGEPLINFELIKKVIIHCKAIKQKKNVNFRFLLATNGTLLTKEKAGFLIKNGVDIAVSLDGSRRIQDLQRPFPNGRGSFDIIMNNINSFSDDYRNRLVGRATFTPYSAKIVENFKFLRNLGFKRIEVCESEKAGYGLESRNKFFFSGPRGLLRLKSLYRGLASFYTQEIIKGNLTYENTYFNRFFKQLSRLYNIHSVIGSCSAGGNLMAVDIDGSIYPCTAFVGLPQFRIGNVKTGLNERKLKNFSNVKISSNNACEKCWAKRLCRGCGSCYNLNYFSNKALGKPDPYYCELFRYKTKLMIAMIAEISKDNPRRLDDLLIPEYYATRGKVRKNKAG